MLPIRHLLNVPQHNVALGTDRANTHCHDAKQKLRSARALGTPMQVFKATVQRDMRCGQLYGAVAGNLAQVVTGIGLTPAYAESCAQVVTGDNPIPEDRPFAGLMNHVVAAASVAVGAVVGAATSLAAGALLGLTCGIVGLLTTPRQAAGQAIHGALAGMEAGFLVGTSITLLVGPGTTNRLVAYGLGAVNLAIRAAGYGAGTLLFGTAGVVHGAVLACCPRRAAVPVPARSGPVPAGYWTGASSASA